jgi:hypothetical protein
MHKSPHCNNICHLYNTIPHLYISAPIQYDSSPVQKSPSTIVWYARQKELSVARLRHSKHAMTLLNRSPSLLNGRVNSVSRERWRYATVKQLREAVFSTRSDTRQQRCNGTRNAMSHTSTEEVFSVRSMLRLYKGVNLSRESVESSPWVELEWVS